MKNSRFVEGSKFQQGSHSVRRLVRHRQGIAYGERKAVAGRASFFMGFGLLSAKLNPCRTICIDATWSDPHVATVSVGSRIALEQSWG